jgi:hypothetical protein
LIIWIFVTHRLPLKKVLALFLRVVNHRLHFQGTCPYWSTIYSVCFHHRKRVFFKPAARVIAALRTGSKSLSVTMVPAMRHGLGMFNSS